jgi:hypothetical protein
MHLGDCPHCQHTRCVDCDVKSHTATDTEIAEEEKMFGRVESSLSYLSMPQQKSESSSAGVGDHPKKSAQDDSAGCYYMKKETDFQNLHLTPGYWTGGYAFRQVGAGPDL